jgi:hypothetical protein
MSKSKYIGDLCFSTGEYEKDGTTKKRWAKAAAAFKDTESGSVTFKFETLPAVDWSGWMRLFPAKNRDENSPQSNFDKFAQKKEDLKQKSQDTVLDDIDNKPIDLSDIPF